MLKLIGAVRRGYLEAEEGVYRTTKKELPSEVKEKVEPTGLEDKIFSSIIDLSKGRMPPTLQVIAANTGVSDMDALRRTVAYLEQEKKIAGVGAPPAYYPRSSRSNRKA